MLKRALTLGLVMLGVCGSAYAADILDIDLAIAGARDACGGISQKLEPMKKMAGINTAVTGVGTAVGVGATVSGFVKQSTDKEAEKIEEILSKLSEIEFQTYTPALTQNQISQVLGNLKQYSAAHKNDTPAQRAALEQELIELTKKSKRLGNLRTGLMAGATATNVAGAVIAANNKVDIDLDAMIANCRASIKTLRDSMMQARIDGVDVSHATRIIDACGEYDTLDLSKINTRADGAKWSSIVGAATGAAGTVTSAIANTDSTRNDNTDSGKSKEKNLNTASNILAIGTTLASGTATVFNATQISAIKSAVSVADKCEGALR